MDFKFEGLVNDLSKTRLEYISKVLRVEGVNNEIVKIEEVGQAGDGYASNMKRIIGKKNGESFKMIAKLQPKTSAGTSSELTKIAFRNELTMYTQTLPKYVDLEKEAFIPECDILISPMIYGAIMEEPNIMILMEDLKDKNYVILDRFKSLSDEAVKLVIKSLASLHAYSFALKNKRPEVFNEISSKLVSPWFLLTQSEDTKVMYVKTQNEINQVLKDEEYKNLFKDTVSKMGELLDEITRAEQDSNFTTIVHGDAWTNNILFRLEGEKISSCCMIDYQVSSIGSPIWDLNWLIFLCTDHTTRIRHFTEWYDFYHQQLTNKLAYFDLKSDDIYGRSQLDDDFKRHSKLCFAHAVFCSTIIIKESKEIAKNKAKESTEDKNFLDTMFETTNLTDTTGATLDAFKRRIKDIVDTFTELGYL